MEMQAAIPAAIMAALAQHPQYAWLAVQADPMLGESHARQDMRLLFHQAPPEERAGLIALWASKEQFVGQVVDLRQLHVGQTLVPGDQVTDTCPVCERAGIVVLEAGRTAHAILYLSPATSLAVGWCSWPVEAVDA